MLIDQKNIPNFSSSDGIMWFYDQSRSKWLSVNRDNYLFGMDSRNLRDSWWLASVGSVETITTGVKIPRDGIITSLSVQVKQHVNPTTADFHIRRNGLSTNLATITITIGSNGNSSNNLNIDVNKDDWLQAYMVINSGRIHYPILKLEVAWRR
jgi:hypothetical protein